eukprot:TRINITY_DN490_c3_g1_i1.p1 TRINITY_DN490_c3_g1~~TRINITY_DN490_c3_g1_i1.p1  ORF type:complete len:239 (-),score=26.89 TRINITY_DN490_c3_g1_i1:275-991(-)
MAVEKLKQRLFSLIILPLISSCQIFVQTVDGQVPIPAKYDGFVYEGRYGSGDTIDVEAFFDPVCPDSRDAWPPLKQALKFYSHRISLIFHPFALPYHDNAFVASRALHIANKLNTSTTYHLMELFFKYQEKFYNTNTLNMSRASIVEHIVKLTAKAVGNSSLSAVEAGFKDTKSDMATRISFKYGCSRGVTGTPFFFVNGFSLPTSGSALDYNKWRSIVDPLLGGQREKNEEPLHFFL